jgi:hypothetical protein
MSEAEVSLRLAFYLIANGLAVGNVRVAIDGAQVRTTQGIHFPLVDFLADTGCLATEPAKSWQGGYRFQGFASQIVIHSAPGEGDVVAVLTNGKKLRVESKKGSLIRSASSSEYPLLREAIGQLMTIDNVGVDDALAVAVPHSAKFTELAERWRRAPLISRLGIRLVTVERDGQVHGLVF